MKTPRTTELSFREKQLVRMLQTGMANKEIAFELHLTVGTIKEYLHSIFRKVGVKNRTELALWGNRQSWIDEPNHRNHGAGHCDRLRRKV